MKMYAATAIIAVLSLSAHANAQTLPECRAETIGTDHTATAMVQMKGGALTPLVMVEIRPFKTVKNGLNETKFSQSPRFYFSKEANKTTGQAGWFKWSLALPDYYVDGNSGLEREKVLSLLARTTDDLTIASQNVEFETNNAFLESDPNNMEARQALNDWLSDPAEGKISLGLFAHQGGGTIIYVYSKASIHKGMAQADSHFANVRSQFMERKCKPVQR